MWNSVKCVGRQRASIHGRLRAYAERDGRGYPDWAMRYLPVLRRLGRRDWSSQRVLEIGANENGFARFSGARVVAIDIEWAQLDAARAAQSVLPALGDIGRLPFADGTFDFVICMDTYEHIPAEHRANANREIIRVLRADGTAVIGFPSGAAAFAAEGRIRDAYHALTGGSIRWLDEHVEMGLPDAGAVREDLAEAAGMQYEVEVVGNASLWAWEWMWRVLMCNWPGRGNALFQVLLRGVVPVLSRLHFGECYRAILWVTPRQGADLGDGGPSEPTRTSSDPTASFPRTRETDGVRRFALSRSWIPAFAGKTFSDTLLKRGVSL